MKYCLLFAGALLLSMNAPAADFFVSALGRDGNPGTAEAPVASLGRAQELVRASADRGRRPVTVHVAAGVYFLPEALVFTPADSGTAAAPVTYKGDPSGQTVISGGSRLSLTWKPYRDGIYQAQTPDGLRFDQLFVDGRNQPMTRYPNEDPVATTTPYHGYAADAISPARSARWADPTGGYIHAMHSARWGGYEWRITGKNGEGELTYEGGWQNNRPGAMHPELRMVENIFEELDAPGEWFHNEKTRTLYFYPPAGVDPNRGVVEVVRLPGLIEFRGTAKDPVGHIVLDGFVFRHAARTFMDTREPLLRSDWTIYRGGALLFNGARDCGVTNSEFDQVGGNAIFVNNWNRGVLIRGCHIHDSGASAVAFVGDPKAVRSPLFNYSQSRKEPIDLTAGPKSDNYPADCVVEDCLIHGVGRVEKQSAGVQISMSARITVRDCSIYDTARAGINVNEGTFGGHLIEGCDVFDTVLETSDHGSFNSWGRDRFWSPGPAQINQDVAAHPDLPKLDMVGVNTIRNSRWRCDHGWDIDLDDGSSNYVITENLLLNSGLKLREGYNRIVTNNVIVNNSLHPHVWLENSGDVFRHNIVMGAYRPAAMSVKKWGRLVDENLFTTSHPDRLKFSRAGCDVNSLVADPMFVDPARGDFSVKPGSPALAIGFRNFPMDRFGVKKPALRALARSPLVPDVRIAPNVKVPTPEELARIVGAAKVWMGVTIRELEGEEYSAYGVTKESGGVALGDIPGGAQLAAFPFKKGDLIQGLDGVEIRNFSDFERVLKMEPTNATGRRFLVIRNQQRVQVPVAGLLEIPR